MEIWVFARENPPPIKKESGIDTGVASAEKIFFTRSIFDCAICRFGFVFV